MKLKLFLPFAFFMFLNALNAQIMYTDEEIKNKYDHETIMLQQNGAEKNGFLMRFNYLFPSPLMRVEIEKNGGTEANKVYKDYKKTIGYYWLAFIIGIVALVISGSFLVGVTTVAAAQSAVLVYMLIAIVFAVLIAFLGKKSFAQLARSIWLHNRNVLLKK
jgi:hypothetical protein